MNKDNVEVGKKYHIEFLGNWSAFDGDYQISSIVSPDAVIAISPDKSIRSIYFTDIGLDEDMYAMYIKPSTLVYTAYAITSKNPVKVDNESIEKILYLPSSLINYDKSYLYLDGVQLKFSVTTGVKYFDSLTNLEKFINNEKVDVKNIFDKNYNFSGETIGVLVDQIEALTTKAEIDNINTAKAKIKDAADKAKRQYQMNIEASERNLYEKVKEATVEKEKYIELSNSLHSKINDAESLRIINEDESRTLNNIKNLMIKMLTMLITGEVTLGSLGNSGSEAFDTLYAQAKENL